MDVAALPKDVRDYVRSLEKQTRDASQRIHTLEIRNRESAELIQSLESRFTALEEQYRLLLLHRFARKSEKSQDIEAQGLLFEEPSSPQDGKTEEDEEQTVGSYSRKKRGRKPLDDSLPREEVILDIPEEDKSCACGEKLSRIGEEVSERLEVIQPRMWVKRIIRPKYACRACEGSGDEEKSAVRIAPAPESIIPKSIVSPGLLSFIITNKFVDHLPYYRQEGRFERIGVHISRQNMSNWQQAAYEKIRPLVELLKHHIRTGPVINMDETPVQVLGEEGRKDTQKSYMWLARGGPPDKPALLYSYRETRGSEHIKEILSGYAGYLQTDGYGAYETALKENPDIIHVGCMAHARRKFDEAAKVSQKAASAAEALKHIRGLYRLESELRAMNLSQEEFLRLRQEKAGPLLTAFRGWLEKRAPQVPPSLALGKAISYTLKEWPKLVRYLDCAELTPDNNAAENAIRPFVLGRKNWLFSGSPSGAESSCAMYSLIETAKHNGLNPQEYLLKVFESAPLIRRDEDWTRLLPWNIISP